MQQMPSTRPLVCRNLIGRERDLEQLGEVFHRTTLGIPQFLLLSGEAGVGKTRLCREFVQSNRMQSALRFWGRALPQDQAIPFAPFLDAFRRSFNTLVHVLRQQDQVPTSSLAFLVQLVPELASHLPDLNTATPDHTATPIWRQQAMFHDLLRVLRLLVQHHQGPVVFVLEDLHWADATSLELLSFLAQRLEVNSAQVEPATPILLLGTYRHEALPDNPPLQQMVWHLQAQRCLTEFHLASLTGSEHRQCINAILDQEVPEHFADFLFAWDEGNPFYTEELLGTLAATNQLYLELQTPSIILSEDSRLQLPSSISAAILTRFVQLPELDQKVLTYAAVIGKTFDFPLLAAVCNVEEHEIAMVLSRAMSRQLLSEVTRVAAQKLGLPLAERYQFRHALIRQAIYDRLHTAERRLYHRAVAEAIERLFVTPEAVVSAQPIHADQTVASLVKHYHLAGLLEQARPYALQEAQRASELCAFREERYYLNLCQASLPEESPERLTLLQRLGMVSLGIYDFEAAIHWLTLVQTCYERLGQLSQALEMKVVMLLSHWFLAQKSWIQLAGEVEAEVERFFLEGNSEHVEVLTAAGHLAIYWFSKSQIRRAAHWIERSTRLYAALDDPRKEEAFQYSIIARSHLKAHQQTAAAEEGIAELRQVLHYAQQHSYPELLLLSYVNLVIILLFRGKLDATEQTIQEAIVHELRSGMYHPSFVLGLHHLFSGQWEQGITLLGSSLERLEQANVPMLVALERMVLAHLYLARSELGEAQRLLQSARPFLEALQQESFLFLMDWGFAKLSMAQGDQLQAQQWYERLLQTWKNTDDTLLILPILLDSILFAIHSNRTAQARQWIEMLRGVVAVNDSPIGVAALAEVEGLMAATEGALQHAIEALRQAAECWSALKWRYRQAEASLQLAELLLTWAGRSSVNRLARQKAREDAEVLLESAESIYERLQVTTGLERIRSIRSHTGVDAQRKRRKTLAERHSSQGLTPREMQVLSLLVDGKANKEIAAQLSITTGTVELHVTHILTKLHCETRVQAIIQAISQGLVKE